MFFNSNGFTTYVFSAFLALWTLGSAPCAHAQDTTLPTIAITSTDIVENGAFVAFILNLAAADDIAVDSLQYRARVNGQSFSPWTDYPYIPGFPLYFNVRCDLFEVEVRAIDSSDNISKAARRIYRRPFQSSPGTPLAPGFVIEEPPSVLTEGSKATVIAKKFAVPRGQPAAPVSVARSSIRRAARRPKKSVVYAATVTDHSTEQVRRMISKKNVFTFKNLPSGVYRASYNAKVMKKKVVLAETTESPEAFFSVN